ncbi:Noc2p family-domain-containing protein [Sporodiniella umbellata]|nr:Noc2p family-domain-containing protein [Sporodiniella umbellata]
MPVAAQKKSKGKASAKPKKVDKKVISKPNKKSKGTKKTVKASVEKSTEDSEDEGAFFKRMQKVMDEYSEESGDEAEIEQDSVKEPQFLSEDDDQVDLDEDLDQDSDDQNALEEASDDEEVGFLDEDEEMQEVDSDSEDEVDNADKLNKDINQHRKEMEELKERDPEFYEFLQKEDGDLLDFDESDHSENEEEEEEMESDEDPLANVPVLSKAKLNEWLAKIKSTNDFKAFKSLLTAFKTAARMSEEDDKITFTIKIEDPNVFSKVITSTLHYAPIIFLHHLKLKKEGESPMTSGRWSFFKSYVKSYLNNLNHLLHNLTDADMHRLTIREAEKCTILFVCFERLAKDYLKTLLHLWSNMSSSDSVRVQAFLAIKSLSVISVPGEKGTSTPQGYLDTCLKNVYLTFVKNCKNTNAHTLPVINLMRNLASQLYGINLTMSYQQAFVYIRQLASYLRTAMKTRSTKNHGMVYNWQYIHCIDFWSDVLNTFAKPILDEEQDEVESPLKPLVYPLAQVAMGVIGLIPTPQYYPLRFHVLKCLSSLLHHTNTFIPLAVYVLEVLESPVCTNFAKKSGGTPLEWDTILKVHKKIVNGRVYQDDVLDQCAKALRSYYKEFYNHAAFPEMVDADIVAIKRFVKQSKSQKGKEKLHSLVKEIEAKQRKVRQARANAVVGGEDVESFKL